MDGMNRNNSSNQPRVTRGNGRVLKKARRRLVISWIISGILLLAVLILGFFVLKDKGVFGGGQKGDPDSIQIKDDEKDGGDESGKNEDASE